MIEVVMSVYNYNYHPGICSCCLVTRESREEGVLPNSFVHFDADLTMLLPHLGAAHEYLRNTFGLHGLKDPYLRGPMAPQKETTV